MSSFMRRTKNPQTGEFEDAFWLDDYFGWRRYGVSFRSTGHVYRETEHEWEFEDEPAQEGGE